METIVAAEIRFARAPPGESLRGDILAPVAKLIGHPANAGKLR